MNATQEWNFDTEADAVLHPKGPKPTPERFRKLLRREEENLESLLPGSTTSAATPETPPPPNGHDARGRFAKDNKCGTGNPFARKIAGFRAALINSVTEQDIADIAQVLQFKARSGDLAAIKLFLAYTVGKPTAPPNPDRLDLEDFQLLRERLSPLDTDWHLIRKMVPVEGIIEAGHRVADLRAAWWREDVLGQRAQPESPPTPAAAQEEEDDGRDPALLREVLAAIHEEPAQSPEWIANMERMLTEADEAGCLLDMLQAMREETEKTLGALNGTGSQLPPLANGESAAKPPSTNGPTAATAPSTNGKHGQAAPSTNGGHGQAGRSANAPPSAEPRR